ncbi:MAG: hypothetical protein AAFX78_03340 [Cyanobacteria bacterium J06638_20]
MASSPHVRVNADVKKALDIHTAETGKRINICASLAIAKWLREQGVDIQYPIPKTEQPATAA